MKITTIGIDLAKSVFAVLAAVQIRHQTAALG